MISKITIPNPKNTYVLIMARAFITGLSFAIILSACSVHKIDIQQGNVITQEMLEKLKIGMDKPQVSRLLGTPLIEDPFHKGRWDYIYKFVAGDTGETQSSHITLFFDGDSLTKIDVREAPPAEADVKKTSLKKR
jgi:outer membrane protein assembly factor BamE